MSNKIVIAGGSGFLGKCLAEHFAAKGFNVVILSRAEKPSKGNISFVKWDAKTGGPWQQELEGAAAVINLAGKSVDCRYNEKNKKEITDSRVNSTLIIGKTIQACKTPPPLWLNSSSATIYRHAEDRPMDERTGEYGSGFSVEVCHAWEKALATHDTPSTRKVALRIAMVLSGNEGVIPPLKNLVRFGMGGSMAGGKQFMSWIHYKDFVRMVQWIVDHKELAGAINICAPNPIINKEVMGLLRKEMGMPFGIPQAKWMLQFGAVLLQTEIELIVKSRRVVPTRMLESGFEFSYPTMQETLKDIINSKK